MSLAIESESSFSTVEVLGVKINLLDYETTIDLMKECISRGLRGKYICACPVHSIMVAQNDNEHRRALNNSWLTVPDGMPVVWATKLLENRITDRVYGPNLMLLTCEMAEKMGYSIFLFGGKPTTLGKLHQSLINRFPQLRIEGTYSPPFRKLFPVEKKFILEKINLSSPDILFFGLGAPKQEKCMEKFCNRINVPVSIGVGAAFDFLSGEKRQAPFWMQNRGLEWLFRLKEEPSRLLYRYIFYNPLFIILFLKQLIGTKIKVNK